MNNDSDDYGFRTGACICGYFDDFVNYYVTTPLKLPPDTVLNEQDSLQSKLFSMFDYYLDCGFRRSENLLYANFCSECTRCIPIRVLVKDFVMNKRYRRILKNNSDIEIRVVKSEITEEKIRLFQKYNSLRHDNHDDCLGHLSSLHCGYDGIYEMDYFLDNKLIAVSILDLGKESTSSNYFYFDPEYSKRSLGVFSVLKEIEFTQQSGRMFYYLGFYIEESEKMRYKSEFQPAQVRIDKEWINFNETDLTIYKSSNQGK